MAAPPASGGAPITDKRDLVAWFEKGNKPAEQWLIGTEHEKLPFRLGSFERIPYGGPDGIKALLEGLAAQFGWQEIRENGNVIALARDNGSITLEPGGQFELSGGILPTLHDTAAETAQHIKEVKAVGGPLGIGMLGLGLDPTWRRDQVPWMPKGRYRIMGEYMPKVGKLGLDMMLRTCTVQVNLDFADEADMVKKFRVSLALQPIATALFANSPFLEGKPNGFKSFRANVWTDTDGDRTGMLGFVFEDGFGFERYVDYLLDVPMYFAYRDGTYLDMTGRSFRDFIAGKLRETVPGEALMTDWSDHVTTAFPEVRLKRFLEMRGADVGSLARVVALSALWVGLLYDRTALDAAWDLCRDWTTEQREALRTGVARQGLAMPFRGGTVQTLAQQVLKIAESGLRARRKLDAAGNDETVHLAPLFEIAESGMTPADRLLAAYDGRWGGSLAPVYAEQAY
jgi:glutamate--cysteine ligase